MTYLCFNNERTETCIVLWLAAAMMCNAMSWSGLTAY